MRDNIDSPAEEGALHPSAPTAGPVAIGVGGGRALFLIDPDDTDGRRARALATQLGAEQSLHALAVRDLPDSVEELAARYITQLRSVQGHGPYRLAGWGAGGVVAYEVACQLIGLDERVEFAGMLAPDRASALDPLRDRYVPQPASVPLFWFARAGAADEAARQPWRAVAGERMRVAVVEDDAQVGNVLATALAHAAGTLAAHPEHRYAPMFTIQKGRPALAPLFCIPGAGASVAAFNGLAMALDEAQPVYGLQPRGLCGQIMPHTDVPSAARAYVRALRAVAPRGPYHLLGHSFGGWVVTEVARQLGAAGDSVASLFVLDSRVPDGAAGRQRRYSRIDILVKLVELYDMSLKTPMGLTAADFAPLDHEAQLALLYQRMVDVKLLSPRTGVQALRGIVRVFCANMNTVYHPAQPYPGALDLFAVPGPGAAPSSHPYYPCELVDGWRRHAPGLRYWSGEGNHQTMLTHPHVGSLARRIGAIMKEGSAIQAGRRAAADFLP